MAKAKKSKSKSYTDAVPVSMRKHSSVSIENADNGFVLRWCDYSGKRPKDVVKVAKTEAEAKKVMTELMQKAY